MTDAVVTFSSCSCEWTYDVFLNFRGEDTRNSFAGNLYNSLDLKGFHVFMDDEELRRGEEITPALLEAIEESKTAIIIFSKDYASSTHCLGELVHILEQLKRKGQLVMPVFYDVDPSDVRHQRGTFSESFKKHEERFRDDKDKVQKWRNALYEAASLAGWHFRQGSEPEYKFIRKVTEEVSKKMNRIPLQVADHPVGLDSPVQEVTSLLGVESKEGVNMLGIYGTGGIGKTTIARAVYNKLIGDQFDGVCFLADIREKSIKQVQETLLSEILGENDIRLGDDSKGKSLIKKRLHRKKVLLILDDVDELKQLKAIAGAHDWFGSGSRIIITTRDTHLLTVHRVDKIYEVKELNDKRALELFCWNAFKSDKVDPSYVDISNRAISYACGLPLALEVIGSNLFGKSLEECKSELDKYERIPIKKVHEVLKVSYNGLEENEKNIFLDIACFFNKYNMRYVKEILYVRGFHPEAGIRVLIDKSLLKTDVDNCVIMHDLIQDMGRKIVRQESPSKPGERSRLWSNEDIVHVLEENRGMDKIEVIVLNMHEGRGVELNDEAFGKMSNLQVLIIGNACFTKGPKHLPNSLRVLDWSRYPSPSLPADFHPKKLVILSLQYSCFKLDTTLKMFDNLNFLDFEGCKFIREVPDLSVLPNLSALCLDDCTNLIEFHHSVAFLGKLILLSAQGCTKLHTFAREILLPSLEILDFRWCSSLKTFPKILGTMKNIREIYLDHTAVEGLPHSIQNLTGLERLYLRKCTSLNQLPSTIRKLPKLEVIVAYDQGGFRLSEPYEDQEKVSSRLLMCPHLQELESDEFELPNVYCTNTSDMDFKEEGPRWTQGMEINLIEQCRRLQQLALVPESRESLVSFWFREKFPKVDLLLVGEPRTHTGIDTSIIELKLFVVVNGSTQYSYSCDFIISTTQRIYLCVFLFDLLCKSDQGKPEEVSFKHEWNHVEVSYELTYQRRYDAKGAIAGPSHQGTTERTLNCSRFLLHRLSTNNEEHIRFTNPTSDAVFESLVDSSNCSDNSAAAKKIILGRLRPKFFQSVPAMLESVAIHKS